MCSTSLCAGAFWDFFPLFFFHEYGVSSDSGTSVRKHFMMMMEKEDEEECVQMLVLVDHVVAV